MWLADTRIQMSVQAYILACVHPYLHERVSASVHASSHAAVHACMQARSLIHGETAGIGRRGVKIPTASALLGVLRPLFSPPRHLLAHERVAPGPACPPPPTRGWFGRGPGGAGRVCMGLGRADRLAREACSPPGAWTRAMPSRRPPRRPGCRAAPPPG